MMTNRKRVVRMLLVITALFLLAVFFAWHLPKKPVSSSITKGSGEIISEHDLIVRIGFLPIYSDLPLFVADRHDEFNKHMLTVKLVPFQDSPSMANSLITGGIDIAASVATASILAVESRDSGQLMVFLVDGENKDNPLTSLVIARDSPIRNIRDLKGKNIASFPGPTSTVWAPLAFEKLGLPRGSYNLIELGIGEHVSALNTKRVDAVVTYEPVATELVLKWGAKKLVAGLIESTTVDPWTAGAWVLSREFFNKDPKVAKAAVSAIYAGVDHLRRNPNIEKQALTKFTAIDPSVAIETPTYPFMKISEVNHPAFQAYSDTLTRAGTLSRDIDTKRLLMEVIE